MNHRLKSLSLLLCLFIALSLAAPRAHAGTNPPVLEIYNKTPYPAHVVVEQRNVAVKTFDIPKGQRDVAHVIGEVVLVGRVVKNGSTLDLPRVAFKVHEPFSTLATITESGNRLSWNESTVAVDASGGFQ